MGTSLASSQRIAALERGSTLLGAGGGGPTPLAASLLRRWTDSQSTTQLRQARELDPGASAIPVGIVGATSALAEKLPSGTEIEAVVRAVTANTTLPRPTALMGMEAGGVNGVMVAAAGAALDMDVVDADLMGRALPRLNQLTTVAAGKELTPVALASSGGWTAVMHAAPGATVERLVRSMLPESGGWAWVALPPVPLAELDATTVVGSLGHALWLGHRHLAQPLAQPPKRTARALGGRLLADGRVIDVTRQQQQRTFVRGWLHVRDTASDALLRIEMENEYLLALRDGEPVATTPDLLCVVDRRSGLPVACDEVRQGQDCYVAHLPGAPFWRDPGLLPAVSPRAFGLDVEPHLLAEAWRTRP